MRRALEVPEDTRILQDGKFAQCWHVARMWQRRMSRAPGLGSEEEETPSCVCGAGTSAPIDLRKFAHSVRNPLNGARLHLVFLERELSRLGASRDAIESAQVIGEEIDRIAELVKDMLDARGSAAQRPRTLLSLNALCARAIELVSTRAREAGVDVGAEFADPDSMLEVHCQEMEQVLFDLLHRALQGALASGAKVLLRARRDAESGQAVIEIRHDGSGGTAALGPSLEPESGSDFRVAMRIVADHGGSIDVSSRPGHASFHVKLPIVRSDAPASALEWG